MKKRDTEIRDMFEENGVISSICEREMGFVFSVLEIPAEGALINPKKRT